MFCPVSVSFFSRNFNDNHCYLNNHYALFCGKIFIVHVSNPLIANPTKSSNTLKQFVDNLPNCLSVFDHFVGLALKGLK